MTRADAERLSHPAALTWCAGSFSPAPRREHRATSHEVLTLEDLWFLDPPTSTSRQAGNVLADGSRPG
jgi:hypothetical protein